MPASAGRDAVAFDAFPSFVLKKQLCGQGLLVEQARVGSPATCRSSVRERPDHRSHARRHAETAHSTSECQQSLPGDVQFFLEEPRDDPCHQNNLSGHFPGAIAVFRV